MRERPADLPEFDEPPVAEVALAVQFEPLQELKSVHLGHLWDVYKERFPLVEDHPPLARYFETFGGPPPGVRIGFQLLNKPEAPRVWFLNEAKTELVQFQSDRFARNWRKLGPNETYPRYEAIRDSFIRELETLSEFVAAHGLGSIKPDQCEVTYINHVVSGSNEDLCRDAYTVLKLWNKKPPPAGGLVAEDGRIQVRYMMTEADQTPIGRLIVTAEPARSQDERPMIVLTLTARGKPRAATTEGVEDFFNRGRSTIVHAFTSLTTSQMHARWKRRQ